VGLGGYLSGAARQECRRQDDPPGRTVAAGQGGRARRNGSRRNGAAQTKEELQEQARALGIEGRSKMSKAQLAKAVASAK
jgi:hypothetical protein